MGVSENRGPYYSTLSRRILIEKRPQNQVPLIFGNSRHRAATSPKGQTIETHPHIIQLTQRVRSTSKGGDLPKGSFKCLGFRVPLSVYGLGYYVGDIYPKPVMVCPYYSRNPTVVLSIGT